MPPKNLPTTYQLLLKTHKLTIFLSASQNATIASLKADALSALSSKVNQAEGVPQVSSVDDFEICRELKEKGTPSSDAKKYETLPARDTVKNTLLPWEWIYIRFRDESGKLLPVEVTIPELVPPDEDEPERSSKPKAEDSLMEVEPTRPTVNKGKRKASPSP
ncbi:hypothetical protein BD410DRAFT_798365 [Rickenella mellea]|uniref:Uncharacterized protein n=1 Tax=Rickenella mellea TaxID=50990 RepID=A0A4R5XFH0_9AGAM|nr:hypothetical protein BD410DRAFT_798365 [Rickenella mellea]